MAVLLDTISFPSSSNLKELMVVFTIITNFIQRTSQRWFTWILRGCRKYCFYNVRRWQKEQMNWVIIMFFLKLHFSESPGISTNTEVMLNALSSVDLEGEKMSVYIQYVTGWYNCQCQNCNWCFYSFFQK